MQTACMAQPMWGQPPRLSGGPEVSGRSGCIRMPALLMVVVRLAGAFECDLILRELAAFRYRRSFRMRIGFEFRRWLRDLPDVSRMDAVDWMDHGGLLRHRIGGGRSDFSCKQGAAEL